MRSLRSTFVDSLVSANSLYPAVSCSFSSEALNGGKDSVHTRKIGVPIDATFCSFQLYTTSSHVRSVRNRCSVGNFGFFDARRNPRCLKVTISPFCGFHRFPNSDVPAGAANRVPFGLEDMQVCVREEGTEVAVQFAFPLILAHSAYNPCFCIPKFLFHCQSPS